MPIYEYQCNDCSERFEITQNVFQPVKPKCPKCSSEKTRRVFSGSHRISYNETPKQSSGFG